MLNIYLRASCKSIPFMVRQAHHERNNSQLSNHNSFTLSLSKGFCKRLSSLHFFAVGAVT